MGNALAAKPQIRGLIRSYITESTGSEKLGTDDRMHADSYMRYNKIRIGPSISIII